MTKAMLIHALRELPDDAPLYVDLSDGNYMILNIAPVWDLARNAPHFVTGHIMLDVASLQSPKQHAY